MFPTDQLNIFVGSKLKENHSFIPLKFPAKLDAQLIFQDFTEI